MYWKLFLLTICVCLTSCEIVVEPREGDLDWWQNSVIYEIFIQSFKDSNGDGFGDFKGEFYNHRSKYFRCILQILTIID